MRHIEAQQIENLFAGNIRNLLMDAKLDYDKLYEIRLRVGRPLFLTYDGGECFLRKPGQEQYSRTSRICSSRDNSMGSAASISRASWAFPAFS